MSGDALAVAPAPESAASEPSGLAAGDVVQGLTALAVSAESVTLRGASGRTYRVGRAVRCSRLGWGGGDLAGGWIVGVVQGLPSLAAVLGEIAYRERYLARRSA